MIFFSTDVRTVLLFAFCQVVGATKPQTYHAERPTDFFAKISYFISFIEEPYVEKLHIPTYMYEEKKCNRRYIVMYCLVGKVLLCIRAFYSW